MNNTENEGEIKFSALLEQIELCLRQRLYYVAIMVSLVIPDIGGAIDSENGAAQQNKYIAWFDKYVKPRYIGPISMTGDECYYLRCSMLHQGKTKHDNDKIQVTFMNFPQSDSAGIPLVNPHNDLKLVEPRTFCNNMIYAAYDWLEVVYDDDLFKQNMKNFMTLYSQSFTGM